MVWVLYNNIVGFLAGTEMLNVGEADKAQIYSRKALEKAEELATADSKNALARSDLAYAFADVGDSLSSAQPTEAGRWYRKSINLTKQLGFRKETQLELAERDESLASILMTGSQAPERLRLLQEANDIRREVARSRPYPPLDRLHLMRSYCRISDAELGVQDLANAKSYAASSLPFFAQFNMTSPSLFVLRDLGLCYEGLGNVQRQIEMSHSLSPSERQATQAEEREWYSKSEAVWNEWKRRGVATPGSERERLKVERLIASVRVSDRKALAVAQ
jgi:tetratricopeptide (TPR) repeat protein